jgi:hypothetical protein
MSFEGSSGIAKNFFKYIFFYIKNCTILDRSIPTREAVVHSIPLSVVLDMTSDVFRGVKGSLSGKNFDLVCRLNFNNFQERKIA